MSLLVTTAMACSDTVAVSAETRGSRPAVECF
jgi:hypothetical protein